MKPLAFVASTLLVLVAAGCASLAEPTPVPEGRRLTGAEAGLALRGRTVILPGRTVNLLHNGRTTTAGGRVGPRERGEWGIIDDQACISPGSNGFRCFDVIETGPSQFVLVTDQGVFGRTLGPAGDPEG